MKKQSQIGMLVLVVIMMTAYGCKKNQSVSPIVGHWGCEQYVSCRTDSLGVEIWDTSRFEAIAGGEYELFFNQDGS